VRKEVQLKKKNEKFCDMKEFWINHHNQNISSIIAAYMASEGNSEKRC